MLPPDDLLSSTTIADRHGFFRRLREHDPVFWSARHKAWSLTSYQDVEHVFRSSAVSAARMISGFRARLNENHRALLRHAMALLDGWLLFNDPPAHTRLRDPVRRLFSPTVIAHLEPNNC